MKKKFLADGRREPLLSPLELLRRLVELLAPPRKHRHRYGGALVESGRRTPRTQRA
jgi:hypothetical protein